MKGSGGSGGGAKRGTSEAAAHARGRGGCTQWRRVGRGEVHLVDPSKHPRHASGTSVQKAEAREGEALPTLHIYANCIDLQRHSSCARKAAAVA